MVSAVCKQLIVFTPSPLKALVTFVASKSCSVRYACHIIHGDLDRTRAEILNNHRLRNNCSNTDFCADIALLRRFLKIYSRISLVKPTWSFNDFAFCEMKEIVFLNSRSSDHRCVSSIIKYENCLVDPGVARAIHCPESNACFLKPLLPCNTVHFGYAIPITVFPLPEDPLLAEIVLENPGNLDPLTAVYLLTNHPELRKIFGQGIKAKAHSDSGFRSPLFYNLDLVDLHKRKDGQYEDNETNQNDGQVIQMATTAKHDLMSKFTEPEEDIAAIAKQISDHAEAIYQTWKSRGLAPTEILNCHGNTPPASRFGSAFTPKASPKMVLDPAHAPAVNALATSPGLDASKLELLVNSFVVEDKARIAAAKTQTCAGQSQKPNSIKCASDKIESSFPAGAHDKPKISSCDRRMCSQPTQISRPVPANQIQVDALDTIEITLPRDVIQQTVPPKHKPAGSKKFDGPVSTGVLTWPLKNIVVNSGNKNMSGSKALPINCEKYLDEVQREEERLINALKSGMIINEELSAKKDVRFLPVTAVTEKEENQLHGCHDTTKIALKNAILETFDSVNNQENPPSSLTVHAKVRLKNDEENQPVLQRFGPSKDTEKVVASKEVTPVPKQRFENNRVNKVEEEATWRHKETKRWIHGKQKMENDEDIDRITCKANLSNKNKMSVSENVPHPDLTNQQKQHLRQAVNSPVRPFLTRGSVAERVLIFEKCPTELLLDKRRFPAVASSRTIFEIQDKDQVCAKDKENQRTNQTVHTTLQRHTRANKSHVIPRFYYPVGKPQNQLRLDGVLQKLAADFRTFPMGQVSREKFHIIVRTCECPLYLKSPLFIATGGDKLGYVEAHSFIDYWKLLTSTNHDPASRFLKILVNNENRNFLVPEDFIPLIQDVVDTHPGLTFLKEANEFHSRYVHTVIARIFYGVNRSWSGRISLPELRRSNLLEVISLLEEEEDINQITQYFSYEHFYVIYCKFWELDGDHDLFIDRQDLTKHNDHALSSRMIDRIFTGAVTRGDKSHPDRMSYTEFVWFLLSEEDKQHPTAIEYWFRCMDLDGDGFLSMYELEYFYEEQLQRMELLGIETLPFEDCLCQMLDMIHPKVEGKISLSDLKKCKMVSIFFDTFFNLEKYLDHEQRDPFASQRDLEIEEGVSDWDRYAAEEYELLVAEEGGNSEELVYEVN